VSGGHVGRRLAGEPTRRADSCRVACWLVAAARVGPCIEALSGAAANGSAANEERSSSDGNRWLARRPAGRSVANPRRQRGWSAAVALKYVCEEGAAPAACLPGCLRLVAECTR